MKKFLLVLMIGMVLTMDIFGIAKDIADYLDEQNQETIDKNYTIVYME